MTFKTVFLKALKKTFPHNEFSFVEGKSYRDWPPHEKIFFLHINGKPTDYEYARFQLNEVCEEGKMDRVGWYKKYFLKYLTVI